MPFTNPAVPNIPDYLTFLYGTVGIPPANLPYGSLDISSASVTIDNTGYTIDYTGPVASWIVPTSLQIAFNWVNTQLACAGIYAIACYNLAADFLLNLAPDVPDQTYFKDERAKLKLMVPQLGIIQSSSNEGSSASFTALEWASRLTMFDIQRLKTPYGRAYLEMAQQAGTLWGLT